MADITRYTEKKERMGPEFTGIHKSVKGYLEIVWRFKVNCPFIKYKSN